VDEAGAGIAVKNTAQRTMILLQGFGVPMRRTNTASVVGRRTGSSKKTTVAVDIVVIVRRGGKMYFYWVRCYYTFFSYPLKGKAIELFSSLHKHYIRQE